MTFIRYMIYTYQISIDCMNDESKGGINLCANMLGATINTNAPIYGILTQPYTGTTGYAAEIEVSHVKFL